MPEAPPNSKSRCHDADSNVVVAILSKLIHLLFCFDADFWVWAKTINNLIMIKHNSHYYSTRTATTHTVISSIAKITIHVH